MTRFDWRNPLLLLGSGLCVLMLGAPLLGLATRALMRGLPGRIAGLPQALSLSLFTTSLALLITLTLGTPLAYILAKRRFRLRWLVNLLVELPIVLPPAVAGLALLVTFSENGLLGAPLAPLGITIPLTTTAVVLAQVFVSTPFYVRAATVGLQSVPVDLEDAARVDGAGERVLFWRITLPIAARAVLAGAVLSWARAVGEFGATLLFAGNLRGATQTMPLLIQNLLERGDLDGAMWAGLVLVGVALLTLAASRLLASAR